MNTTSLIESSISSESGFKEKTFILAAEDPKLRVVRDDSATGDALLAGE